MTLEALDPSPPYTVSNSGPYTITHPYRDANDLYVTLRDGEDIVALTLGEHFTVAPLLSATTGTLTLRVDLADTYADWQIHIERLTPAEQGWEAVTGPRESGLERQLDFLTMAVQDIARRQSGEWDLFENPPPPDVSDADMVIDVGVGGDYTNLPDAFAAMARYAPGRNQRLSFRIISPLTHGLHLDGGSWSHCRITSGMGTVTLAGGFTKVDTSGIPIDELSAVYSGNGAVFRFENCEAPTIGCLIDMDGFVATGALNNNARSRVLPDCGIINAGVGGFIQQGGDAYCLETVWNGAGGEGIRIQQACTATFQGATANDCQAVPAISELTSQAAVFVSRASNVQFQDGEAKDSGRNGVSCHRAFLSMTDADVSGAAVRGGEFSHGARVVANRVDFSGAGEYAISLGDGAEVGAYLADCTGWGLFAVRMIRGGGRLTFHDATTHASSPNVPREQDFEQNVLLNIPGGWGLVSAEQPEGTTRLTLMGVFSDTGASNGKRFAPASVLASSRDAATAQVHQEFYNTTGLAATIYTDGSGGGIATISTGEIKENQRPAEPEAALDRVLAWEVKDFEWPDGKPGRGLIAEEHASRCPAMVFPGVGQKGDPDYVPPGLDYAKGMPDVILSVQGIATAQQGLATAQAAANARIAALEAALAAAGGPSPKIDDAPGGPDA